MDKGFATPIVWRHTFRLARSPSWAGQIRVESLQHCRIGWSPGQTFYIPAHFLQHNRFISGFQPRGGAQRNKTDHHEPRQQQPAISLIIPEINYSNECSIYRSVLRIAGRSYDRTELAISQSRPAWSKSHHHTSRFPLPPKSLR